MLIDFFTHLRRHKLPCSLRELLDLHAALATQLASLDMDEAVYRSEAETGHRNGLAGAEFGHPFTERRHRDFPTDDDGHRQCNGD